MPYRVLYLLQSAHLLVFELKRLDLPATAPVHQLFHWFSYDPATNLLTHLDFVAMHSAPPLETRKFRQGSLRFSDQEGSFHPVGATEAIALRRDHALALPLPLAEQLSAWLQA